MAPNKEPNNRRLYRYYIISTIFLATSIIKTTALSTLPTRRDVIRKTASIASISASTALTTATSLPHPATAAPPTPSTITTPPPLIKLSSSTIPTRKPLSVPRIGYSLYKTPPSQAGRGTAIALATGVRHIDVASSYGNSDIVGDVLSTYLRKGVAAGLDEEGSKLAALAGVATPSDPFSSPQKRRKSLFVCHKVSNDEQSINPKDVATSVKDEMTKLQLDYLDMVCVHSPLTDKERRLGTYDALLQMCQDGFVKSVGVCNYGVKALNEIVLEAGLVPPSMIQLELSPFNQHADVQQWAREYGSCVSCAAWSKLSGVSGPQDGWATVSAMAQQKSVTKAQILVKWALLKGLICVPRSGTGSKLERLAIVENSYNGVRNLELSAKDLSVLDGLEEGYSAGRLGRRDGWNDEDVKGDSWDPTNFV